MYYCLKDDTVLNVCRLNTLHTPVMFSSAQKTESKGFFFLLLFPPIPSPSPHCFTTSTLKCSAMCTRSHLASSQYAAGQQAGSAEAEVSGAAGLGVHGGRLTHPHCGGGHQDPRLLPGL